jgi:hypothetical protein
MIPETSSSGGWDRWYVEGHVSMAKVGDFPCRIGPFDSREDAERIGEAIRYGVLHFHEAQA